MSFDQRNLQPFGPEIWIADGPVASFHGFPYSTRMAVIRLSDGSLFVWSPVALAPALRAAVEALGPLRHRVSPNALHHLFLADWTSAYPQARLYAPPRLRRKRRDLSFDAELADMPEPACRPGRPARKLCAHPRLGHHHADGGLAQTKLTMELEASRGACAVSREGFSVMVSSVLE